MQMVEEVREARKIQTGKTVGKSAVVGKGKGRAEANEAGGQEDGAQPEEENGVVEGDGTAAVAAKRELRKRNPAPDEAGPAAKKPKR